MASAAAQSIATTRGADAAATAEPKPESPAQSARPEPNIIWRRVSTAVALEADLHPANNRAAVAFIATDGIFTGGKILLVEKVRRVELQGHVLVSVAHTGVDQSAAVNLDRVGLVTIAGTDITHAATQAQAFQSAAVECVVQPCRGLMFRHHRRLLADIGSGVFGDFGMGVGIGPNEVPAIGKVDFAFQFQTA